MSAPAPRWPWLQRALWALAFGLLLLLWRVPDLSSRLQNFRRRPLALAPGCDAAAGPCAVVGEGLGPMRVSLDPSGMPSNTPITVRFEAPAGAFDAAELVWTGADMNMGRLPAPMREAAPGRFEATLPLPACVQGAMVWRLDLLLEGPGGPAALTLRLPSGGPGGGRPG